jgi:pimeloyl-ACP methyl ester carboxylesterase/ABC-type uncharacterized transport system auxiliary subunit
MFFKRINGKYQLKVAVLACLVVILQGCQMYEIRSSDPTSSLRQLQQNALNSSVPSRDTQQLLRLAFLDKRVAKEPQAVISELTTRARQNQDNDSMVAAAELSLLRARQLRQQSPEQAIAMYLSTAALAHDYLLSGEAFRSFNSLKPSYRFMAEVYNRALSRLVEINCQLKEPWEEGTRATVMGTTYDLSVSKSDTNTWNPKTFDALYPANRLVVKGLRNRYVSRGIGSPLVGFVDSPRDNLEFGKYSPAGGLAYPLTAILEFGPVEEAGADRRKAEIRFYDPLMTDTALIQGQQIPLETDYTAALGVLLAKLQPQKLGFAGMLDSAKYFDRAGLYMLEPFRKDKIPVVMVHGLMSTPDTWANMFNDLRGDPYLRDKYQFWFFAYPTGLPIIYSASLLRNELKEVLSTYDPQDTNANLKNMVLVGHSMGGLLSRLMVQNSEGVYYDSVFAKPVDSLSVDESTRELLKSIYFFESLPFVKRVVFVATPHRGSNLADAWFSKIGSSLVALPGLVTDAGEAIFNLDRSELAIDPAQFSRKVPNSIDQLSPSSNFLVTTVKVPLDSAVPHHSIIGVRNSRTGHGSSDGIVPYWSSHLDTAVSEKLVPFTHSAHIHPLAIEEVKRILRLHLK